MTHVLLYLVLYNDVCIYEWCVQIRLNLKVLFLIILAKAMQYIHYTYNRVYNTLVVEDSHFHCFVDTIIVIIGIISRILICLLLETLKVTTHKANIIVSDIGREQ